MGILKHQCALILVTMCKMPFMPRRVSRVTSSSFEMLSPCRRSSWLNIVYGGVATSISDATAPARSIFIIIIIITVNTSSNFMRDTFSIAQFSSTRPQTCEIDKHNANTRTWYTLCALRCPHVNRISRLGVFFCVCKHHSFERCAVGRLVYKVCAHFLNCERKAPSASQKNAFHHYSQSTKR